MGFPGTKPLAGEKPLAEEEPGIDEESGTEEESGTGDEPVTEDELVAEEELVAEGLTSCCLSERRDRAAAKEAISIAAIKVKPTDRVRKRRLPHQTRHTGFGEPNSTSAGDTN